MTRPARPNRRDTIPQVIAPTDLQVPPLTTLHTRRSMKWDGHPSDVLAATVAEMDFPVAAPITAALRAAIDRHDLGYAQAHIPRLAEALSGFAARRLRWRVDPEQVRLLPDVMVGVLELARLLAGENRAVAFATPAYRPFLADLPPSGLVVQEIALSMLPWFCPAPHTCGGSSCRMRPGRADLP